MGTGSVWAPSFTFVLSCGGWGVCGDPVSGFESRPIWELRGLTRWWCPSEVDITTSFSSACRELTKNYNMLLHLFKSIFGILLLVVERPGVFYQIRSQSFKPAHRLWRFVSPGIVFLIMFFLFLLLLQNKHCIGEIRVFHEKRSYKPARRCHQHNLTDF